MDPMDFRRRLTEEIPPDQMMQPPAPPQGQQAPPIDIRAYLMDKYKMQGGPSAEVPEAAGRGQQFLAALGAGLQGRDQSAAVAALDSGRNQALAEQDSDLKRMMAFDKLKKDDQVFDRETGEFEKQQAKKASMADPSSDYSKFAQQLAMGMGYQGDPSTLSAEQFSSFSPFFKQKLEQDERVLDRDARTADRNEARSDRKAREQADLALKRDALDLKKQESEAKRVEGKTEGQKSLDKTYAKAYDDWTSTGKPSLEKNLSLLENSKAKLLKEEKASFGTSGRLYGRLPDVLKSESAIVLRDDVRKAAQASLKATLGAQFTEKEGERIMRMSYDETLSPTANIKKIDSAILELKGMAANNQAKADFFQENGTLTGYKPGGSSDFSQGSQQPKEKAIKKKMYSKSSDKTKIVYEDGSEEIVDGQR